MKLPNEHYAYEAWLQQQLEPEDIIWRGNHKRYKPVSHMKACWTEWDKANKTEVNIKTDAEYLEIENNHLKKHGL